VAEEDARSPDDEEHESPILAKPVLDDVDSACSSMSAINHPTSISRG